MVAVAADCGGLTGARAHQLAAEDDLAHLRDHPGLVGEVLPALDHLRRAGFGDREGVARRCAGDGSGAGAEAADTGRGSTVSTCSSSGRGSIAASASSSGSTTTSPGHCLSDVLPLSSYLRQRLSLHHHITSGWLGGGRTGWPAGGEAVQPDHPVGASHLQPVPPGRLEPTVKRAQAAAAA